MTRGTVSKLVSSFGSTWGRIKVEGQEREIYFNASTLVAPSGYAGIGLGQAVEFDEEPDRANGTRAERVKLVAAPSMAT